MQEKNTQCSQTAGRVGLAVSALWFSVFGDFSRLVHLVRALPSCGGHRILHGCLCFSGSVPAPALGGWVCTGLSGEFSPFSHPVPKKTPLDGYLRLGIGKRSAHKWLVIGKVAICSRVCVFRRAVLWLFNPVVAQSWSWPGGSAAADGHCSTAAGVKSTKPVMNTYRWFC